MPRSATTSSARQYEIWVPDAQSRRASSQRATPDDRLLFRSSRGTIEDFDLLRPPPLATSTPIQGTRDSIASNRTWISYENDAAPSSRPQSAASVASTSTVRSGHSAMSGSTLCSRETARTAKKVEEPVDYAISLDWFRDADDRRVPSSGRTSRTARQTSAPMWRPSASVPAQEPGMSRTMQYALADIHHQFVTKDWPEHQAQVEKWMGRVEQEMRVRYAAARPFTATTAPTTTTPTTTVVAATLPTEAQPLPRAVHSTEGRTASTVSAFPPDAVEIKLCVQKPSAPGTREDQLVWCIAYESGKRTRGRKELPEYTVLRLSRDTGRAVAERVLSDERLSEKEFPAGLTLEGMSFRTLDWVPRAALGRLERIAEGMRASTYQAWFKGVYHIAKDEGLFELELADEQKLFAGPRRA